MGAIRIKRRSSTGSTGAPATLLNAELAYNEADNTLYYGYGDNGSGGATSVVSIAGQGAYATLNTAQTITGNKVFSGNLTYTGSIDSNANNTQVATTGWVKNRISESAYLLPAATESSLGGVIIGNGLTVQANGSISVGNYVKNESQYGNLTVTDSVAISGGLQSELYNQSTGEKIITYVVNGGVRTDYLVNTTTSGQYKGGTVVGSSIGLSINANDFQTYPSNGTYTQLQLTNTDATLNLGKIGTATALTKVWTTNSILTQGYADSRYIQNSNLTGTVFESFTPSGNGYLLAEANATNGMLIGTFEFPGYSKYRGTMVSESDAFKTVGLIDGTPQISWSSAIGTMALEVTNSDVRIEDTTGSKTWESRSILTRGYADSRYLQSTGTGSIGDLTVTGNLTVQGTTTTLNTDTLVVEDKNIVIANVTSPTDLTADGGGLTLLGATNKTFNWYDATDAWTSSEHFDLANGKQYKINNVAVLTASGLGSSVVSSSLTSVGTISSGTWQGTTVGVSYGGTGSTSITGLVKGNGASPMTAATAGTDYLAPDSTIDGGTF